jgi:cation diffusion facilitator family transporter
MSAGWQPRTETQTAEGVAFSMLSVATNAAMGVMKFAVGVAYGSPALMAGALYSVNDLLSSVAVSVSLRLSGREPTREYPWGFEKAEFVATGITGVVLTIAVSGVFVYQFKDLVSSQVAPPHITALGVAVLSIFVSGYVYHRARELSRELSSPALHTTAEHSKADAISSVAVLIGIGAAAMGLHVVDRIVAVFEIGHIMFLAGELLGAAIMGLMDHSLPMEDLEMIRRACVEVNGVEEVVKVRSRKGSRSCWVDVVVSVSRELTVDEAHELTGRAAHAIREVLGESSQSRVRFQSVRLA